MLPKPLPSLICNSFLYPCWFAVSTIVQQLLLADMVQTLQSTQSALPLSSPVSPITLATARRN